MKAEASLEAVQALNYRTRKTAEDVLRLVEKLEAGESQASAARILIQNLKRLSLETDSLSTSRGLLICLTDLLFEVSSGRADVIPMLRHAAEELKTQHSVQFHPLSLACSEARKERPDYRTFRIQQTMELGDIKGAVKEAPLRRKNWELHRDPYLKCEPKEDQESK